MLYGIKIYIEISLIEKLLHFDNIDRLYIENFKCTVHSQHYCYRLCDYGVSVLCRAIYASGPSAESS